MMFYCSFLVSLAMLCTSRLQAQDTLIHPKQRIQIILLGTYHFANPGADKFNVKVDDYIQPERQRQIQDVNNALARFNPEKIFTESNIKYQTQADSFFTAYKAGKIQIPANAVNERLQIGMKLAKQLNNKRIYAVDADGKWLKNEVEHYADSMHIKYLTPFEKSFGEYISYYNQYMLTHTVKENLIYLNRPEDLLNHNHIMYNYVFARIGAGDNYIGAELVGEWYKRNVKIYANILKNVTPDDRRLLVVFGSGHIHILKQLFKDNSDFEVIEANTYLAKK
ncbi:DUF5694 domain-containing protein [Mucilaginibacter sp. CSA2-8R]|uniref:DUF5694 domain-containing protein n=1 Tax=Mucilaginibacter sp. CSA2-8R TaxID=3141542 RepID=UPI00315DB620